MGYNQNNHSDKRRSFGNKRDFGNNRSDRPTTFYPATCGNCGRQCEVPFRPTGERPVLCKECFQQNGGPEERRNDNRSFDRPRFDKPRFESRQAPAFEQKSADAQYKEHLTAINVKLDKIINILLSQTHKEAKVKAVKEAVEAVASIEAPQIEVADIEIPKIAVVDEVTNIQETPKKKRAVKKAE